MQWAKTFIDKKKSMSIICSQYLYFNNIFYFFDKILLAIFNCCWIVYWSNEHDNCFIEFLISVRLGNESHEGMFNNWSNIGSQISLLMYLKNDDDTSLFICLNRVL